MLGFYTFAGLVSSQLANHLVNEIKQGPCYVKKMLYIPKLFEAHSSKSAAVRHVHGHQDRTCLQAKRRRRHWPPADEQQRLK